MRTRGRFIVLDGIDGTGKSTQIRRLAAAFRKRGRKVLVVKDPGQTALGERLRAILLSMRTRPMAPATEALLYAGSRAQLVHERIRPALKRGVTVISDRYSTATLAYQGALGKTGPGLAGVCAFAEDGVRPDLTLILDCDPRLAARRRAHRADDRLEARGLAYQRKVRALFLQLARRDPRRIKVVSALGAPDEVTARLLKALR